MLGPEEPRRSHDQVTHIHYWSEKNAPIAKITRVSTAINTSSDIRPSIWTLRAAVNRITSRQGVVRTTLPCVRSRGTTDVSRVSLRNEARYSARSEPSGL